MQKILIDGLAAQQIDFQLPTAVRIFEIQQLALQICDFPLVIVLGLKTALAVDRVPDEIAANGARNAIEQKRIENGTKTPANKATSAAISSGARSPDV